MVRLSDLGHQIKVFMITIHWILQYTMIYKLPTVFWKAAAYTFGGSTVAPDVTGNWNWVPIGIDGDISNTCVNGDGNGPV